jgi:hypothetical protein
MTKLKRLIDPRYNRIEVEHNKWYALDGKALRGIEAQGERVLLAVSHVERKTVTQKWMQGPKES